jgi:hypothetical protein
MAGYLGNKLIRNGKYTTDELTSSGGTTYTLSRAPGDKNNIQVSAGGLAQYPSAYSVSGTTLTLSGVPSGQKIIVRHMGETILYPLLDDGIVTSAKIANDSVTGAKLNPALIAGDVIYADGTDTINRLAKGTAGQVLKMNSGATAPEWGADEGLPTAGADGQVLTSDGTNWASEATAGGDTLLQKKWYYFSEGSNLSSSNAWADAIHPIGDGTLTITPAASGNIIEIGWNWYVGHSGTWHTGNVRLVFASGGSYATSLGLGNTCGWGTMSNNTNASSSDSFSGTAWVAAANTNAHTFKFQHNGGSGAPGIHINQSHSFASSLTASSIVSIAEYDATSSAITAGGAL